MQDKPTHSNIVHSKQLLLDFEPDPLQLMSVEEIYDNANEELLSKLKEDIRIERKHAKFSGESLGHYFSMWANTDPDGGLIVLGQRDGGKFEGLAKLDTDSLNNREKTGHVFCPDAKYTYKKVPVVNDAGDKDFVLLFRVFYNPDSIVRTTNQKVFRRKGDSCIELRDAEIRELQGDKGQVSFENQACELNWPADYDLQSIASYIKKVRSSRNLPEHLTTEDILVLRRLAANKHGKFEPTYACALLFAKDPLLVIPGCKIKFTRFEGEKELIGESYNSVKEVFLEGTIPILIQQAEQLLESQLRTFAPLDSKLKFQPRAEYPKLAWYEVIVNACVHRSYGNGLKNMPIAIKMFDDRLVVESPGPFPPYVTPENIYNTHQPRNPNLMDAMYYMEYVRCAHEGTRRIRDVMASESLPPPVFIQASAGPVVVSVTLKNNAKQRRAWIDQDVSKIISESIAADLSEDERRILNLVAANKKLTVSEAGRMLGANWNRTYRLLLTLTAKRILQYVRFRDWDKNVRDPNAYFQLRSSINQPLPETAFVQEVSMDEAIKRTKRAN